LNADLEQLKLTIKQAWLTLSMLPDPDARYRRPLGGGWVLKVVQDANTAYGATPASWKGTPTPAAISMMEIVFDWLAWLRRAENEYSIRRLAAWGFGVPVWKMAQREQCTEKTIHNRIDRSAAKILLKFQGGNIKIESINEPELKPARIRGFTERATMAGAPDSLEAGRVYIEGIGFMFRGEKYRSTYDAGADFRGKRQRG